MANDASETFFQRYRKSPQETLRQCFRSGGKPFVNQIALANDFDARLVHRQFPVPGYIVDCLVAPTVISSSNNPAIAETVSQVLFPGPLTNIAIPTRCSDW